MIRWLDGHKIKNDRDLVGMVLKPIFERYMNTWNTTEEKNYRRMLLDKHPKTRPASPG